MTNAIRILVGVIVLMAVAAGSLVYYAQNIPVPEQEIEKVIPNDQFPR